MCLLLYTAKKKGVHAYSYMKHSVKRNFFHEHAMYVFIKERVYTAENQKHLQNMTKLEYDTIDMDEPPAHNPKKLTCS